jgi:hypothetical protein
MSIVLDATTKKLELVLGGAVTTNELQWVTNYADKAATSFVPGSSDGVSNGATEVTIAAAPGADEQRLVNMINVYNTDTVDAVVTIKLDNDGTDRTLVITTLDSGDTLQYANDKWRVISSDGSLKQALASKAENISIEDDGDIITATDVEGALQENRTALDLNTTHRTSDGTDHGYIDQDVTSGASPTLDGDNFTGIDADDVDIADAGEIITATDVEGALQENRTALNLNTTHRTSNGSDHGYIDQDVTSGASPTLDGENISNITLDGELPVCDDSSIDDTLDAWNAFKPLLDSHVNAGTIFEYPVVSTYSLAYTATNAYIGGVLSPNGDIHFVPFYATVGQKISPAGVVSTYSLVYKVANAYIGGVLAPNGDIHFVPFNATVGQKISPAGVVSTYSLVYTVGSAYAGGVLSPNGDIHFVPRNATVGQKISSAGVVSTYSLVYTVAGAYYGGVLSPNGDVHFVPYGAAVGQKISPAGVVSTYSLVYTVGYTYAGGVLAPNGDIHFVPLSATVGQKISPAGVVSTYSLVYTVGGAYAGGVLSPNGDIHFVPFSATVGQKISSAGVVSTYSLAYAATYAYAGGVLSPNGDIHFVPRNTTVGQKISTLSDPLPIGVCCASWYNKF